MDKLDEIMAWKRQEVEQLGRTVRDSELERWGEIKRKGPSFSEALSNPAHLSIIAEIKRKSPSAGDIQADANASEQARLYTNANVDALSVLTDEKFFGGSLRDLWDVNDLLQTRDLPPPSLRKDFMLDRSQVLDAAEAGAKAILIIVRALDNECIKMLYDAANLAGLDTLFEIHSEAELDKVLSHKPQIIGVNNRDLSKFTTDIAISEKLIPMIPDGIIKVSESGIHGFDDASRAYAAGADAVLVGEALMRADNLEALVGSIQEAGLG